MDSWSTTKREFKDGNELLASQCAVVELHASMQSPEGNGETCGWMGTDMDTFVEILKEWPQDFGFCDQDRTLYMHISAATGNKNLLLEVRVGRQ